MLSIKYLQELGTAKLTTLLVMQDRGFTIQDERELAALTDKRHDAGLHLALQFAAESLELQPLQPLPAHETALPSASGGEGSSVVASLANVMSRAYLHADGVRAVAVVFVDRNLEDGREKMTSSEQIHAAVGHADHLLAALQGPSSPPLAPQPTILVYGYKLSPDAKKKAASADVQVMSHAFLAFPVGRHSLVPPHRVLTKEEADALLTARRMTADQLPQMKASDPIAIYLGFQRGAIVHTRRGHVDTFRRVTA